MLRVWRLTFLAACAAVVVLGVIGYQHHQARASHPRPTTPACHRVIVIAPFPSPASPTGVVGVPVVRTVC